jgi:hypothetical protein
MRPEHEQRFNRIVNDYLEPTWRRLRRAAAPRAGQLTRGSGSRAVRAEIRAQARKDKIRVVTSRNREGAFAARHRPVSDAEMRVELARGEMLRSLAATARELGHHPGSWLRSGDESITVCSRCDARIYVRTTTAPVTDGEALRKPCSGA